MKNRTRTHLTYRDIVNCPNFTPDEKTTASARRFMPWMGIKAFDPEFYVLSLKMSYMVNQAREMEAKLKEEEEQEQPEPSPIQVQAKPAKFSNGKRKLKAILRFMTFRKSRLRS